MAKIPEFGETHTHLKDNVFLQVGIDGYSLPKGTINAFETVEIIENIGSLTPFLKIKANDENNYLQNELNLHDQNHIQVSIKRKTSDPDDTFEFMLFNQQVPVYSHGFTNIITGMIDAPNWIQDTQIKAYADKNSYEALSAVVSECGLKPEDIQTTTDKMTWLNPGLTRAAFAKMLQDHSFKKADGLMRMGIRANKKVRFVDVFARIQEEPIEKFVYGDIKDIPGTFVRALRPRNAHGFVNSWASYGYKSYEPQLDGTVKMSDAIEVSLDGPYAPYNEDHYNAVSVGRYDYVPTDCGNTYPNYWHNHHNNFRKSLLFTSRVDIVVYEKCKAQLLDVVELYVQDMQPGDEVGRVRGGKYIVTGKKYIMRGTHYAEAFMLMRVSEHEEGKGKLLKSDGKGVKGHTPLELKGPTKDGGQSDWTYINEDRQNRTNSYGQNIDGCNDIVDEECMPTASRSTGWDDVQDFTDGNSANNGPYKVSKTSKTGEVKSRDTDTDPP